MELAKFIIHLFWALPLVVLNGEVLSPIITLHNGGQIQGHQLLGQQNNKYWSFQEIPYGAPPVGNRRFKPAVEPEVWNGVLKTTKNTKICTQLNKNSSNESEDCLYLNVYTPADLDNPRDCLPVYVYLHGGEFVNEDGTFESLGPRFSLHYGVIIVTLNFRLGAFGFLSTGDDEIPGNYGLKDQNLALKWVQKNIHKFGGNPNKVTIGGQGSGAVSVGHHILSEKSSGLFRAALQQSGSPLCSKAFSKNPRYFAIALGKLLSDKITDSSSSKDLLKVLRKAKAEDIKRFSSLIQIPDNLRNLIGNVGNTIWTPVIESHPYGFVRGAFHENFKNGRFNRVPIIVGFNSEEEISFDLDKLKTQASVFDSKSLNLINGNLNIREENKVKAGDKLKKIYTDKTFAEDFLAFVKVFSDAKYTTAIFRQAELQSRFVDVLLYQFSYRGPLGGVQKPIPGVGHGEEVNYLFETTHSLGVQNIPPTDLRIQEQLLTLGTNFVKHLDPVSPIPWPKVQYGNLAYLNVNVSSQIQNNPRYYGKIKEVYDEYAEEYQFTY